MLNDRKTSSLATLSKQRSHVLFVLSNPQPSRESAFLGWYQGPYRRAVLDSAGVISAQHYERHEVDITCGALAPLPFRYMGIYDLSLDGAPAAESLIERVTALHRQQDAAEAPATWLYYPLGEKVGRSPPTLPSMLTVAFANPVDGQEADFREWYATRHIRHALHIPALVSGQCFERTLFQRPGTLEPAFTMIAVYEQVDSPQSIIDSIASLPPKTFHFPSKHDTRFAEWVYRPVRMESTSI